MGDYIKYMAVFQTPLVHTAPKKVVSHPLKIEFFRGPRSFQIPIQTGRVLVQGKAATFGKNATLNLGDDSFVSLSVRTSLPEPREAQKYCEDRVDAAIANLSVLLDPGLFEHQVYRGWIFEGGRMSMEAWIRIKPPVTVPLTLPASLDSMGSEQSKDDDLRKRYVLMSRFLSKALLVVPGEERFLYLWTILEIFPMKDTTDIRPISEFLSGVTGKPPSVVKEKLGIGKLFGARSNLVHNGRLGIPLAEFGETLDRLEQICIEVLRTVSGIPYSGNLDKYFAGAAAG